MFEKTKASKHDQICNWDLRLALSGEESVRSKNIKLHDLFDLLLSLLGLQVVRSRKALKQLAVYLVLGKHTQVVLVPRVQLVVLSCDEK